MKKLLTGTLSVALCSGLLAGCVSDDSAGDEPAPPPATDQLSQEELRAELRSLLTVVADEYGGRVGIAVAGRDWVVRTGLTGHSYAWSTIKVPVAVVADREDVATKALIEASISRSDNAAAYQLSQAIDLDLGDLPHTPELEPLPGETLWTLTEQAQFAATLPCVDETGTTFDAMADIVDWQQWGLAHLEGAHFKGGWGPDTPDVFTVRQMATVPAGGGYLGIAVITHPDDADPATGEAILDAVSIGLSELLDERAIGPAAICSG